MKRLAPYLIFVLITAGVVAFTYKHKLLPSAADIASAPAASSQPGNGRHGGGGGMHRRSNEIVPVVAGKVATANVPIYLNGVGAVQAFYTATVRTQVSGRLTDVPYTGGQDVKEGDVLAKDVLDASSIGPVDLQAVSGAQILGEGKLLVVDNQINQTTGTYQIKGLFPNQHNRLWPGQFVNVKLKLKILSDAIVVPSVAVQEGANGSYVYLVRPDNTAKMRPVSVVQEGERQTVIGSGVSPGDLIVTAGFASLEDGSKVKVEATGEASVAGSQQAAVDPPATDSAQAAASGGSSWRQKQRDTSTGGSGAAGGEHRNHKRQSLARVAEAPSAGAGQGCAKP